MAEYGDAPSDDYKGDLNEGDKAKAELLTALLDKVHLTDDELKEISGLSGDIIESIRSSRYQAKNEPDEPLSWDYILAFNVGSQESVHKPNKSDIKKQQRNNIPDTDEWKEGMPEPKYNGQVMFDFWRRLEYAKLSVKAFRSPDKLMMFLVVGITEKNLKYWADVRNTDLLVDPKGAMEVGCKMKFPLALRTNKGELDVSNWDHLYVEYHPNADPSIYTQYNRIKNDEKLKTVFDEKTRLRIIYECITTDQNDGGGEIAVTDLVADKKHPLVACFPLHNQDVLDDFDKNWIKNYKCTALMWCPLPEIRDYFGEPVAFYFGFLSFYMKWLVPISIIGTVFFVMQMAGIGGDTVPAFDAPGLWAMGIIIIMWSVAFVDFWLRQEARYRMMWGMSSYQEKAVARPQFVGEWKPDPVTGLFSEQFDFAKKLCRLSAVFSGLIFFLAVCVTGVIGVLLFKDQNPNDTGLKILLGVVNAIMIFAFNVIYKISSGKGNDFENHKTQQDYEDALITKGFIFKFINSFSSLIYLAFIRPGVKSSYYYVHYYDAVCGDAWMAMGEYVRDWNAGIVDPDELEPLTQGGKTVTNDQCPDLGSINGLGLTEKDARTRCVDNIFDDDRWAKAYEGWTFRAGQSSNSTYANPDEPICDLDTTVSGEENEAILNEVFFQLASLFITMIIIQNGLEVGIPFLVGCCKGNARTKKAAKEGRKLEPQSEAEKQSELAPYENTIDDMTELIVQFGYVTLFVMAFPLTPLLAWINNVLEMKVDAINLVKTSQRPHPNGSFGIGSWNGVLSFFSIISVATNVGMITFRTGIVGEILKGNPAAQWIFFSVLSVILALVVSLEKWIIPDVPQQCILVAERQRLVENTLVRGAKVDEFEDAPPDTSDDVDTNDFPFDPEKEHVDAEQLGPIPLENLQWTKLDEPSA